MKFFKIFIFVAFIVSPLSVFSIDSNLIIEKINRERERYNKPDLITSGVLADIAWRKSLAMSKNGFLQHSPEASGSLWPFFREAGYVYKYAGENLAVNIKTEEEIVYSWMNSTTHRQNILSDNFSEIGVAITYGNYMGETSPFITAYFAQPKETESKNPVQEEEKLRELLSQLIVLLNTYLALLQKMS